MEFTCVPIIVICCYIVGEIYKVIFENNKKLKKLMPIVITIIGGIFGIVIYKTNPELIFSDNNFWSALTVGMVSGASSTGANKIIEKVFKNKKDN